MHSRCSAGSRILFSWLIVVPLLAAGVDSANTPQLVSAAAAALQQGQHSNAIALATKALMADGASFRALAIRGRAYSLSQKPALAVADYSAALKLDSKSASLYQARGEEYFRLAQFKESVADFDRFLELMPEQKPHHWQRGISCYYAGQFEEGRKQFELHQTVNARDVENAVWHFLCTARLSGIEQARATLIPIEGDRRVPMSQVHSLFAGLSKPADVLQAAKAGSPSPPELNNRLFFAHLYLGLYFEATGDAATAREHIFKAAADSEANHYMGDVARSHAIVLRQKEAKAP